MFSYGKDDMIHSVYSLVPESDSFSSQSASATPRVQWKGRIVVLWSGLGEYAWTKRLEKACQNLGWEMRYSIDPAELSDYDKLVQSAPSTPADIQNLVQEFDPDCVISLKWQYIYSKDVSHYLSATGVFKQFINTARPVNDLLSFHGILNAVSVDTLKEYFEINGKSFHSMEWYPSSTATQYRSVEPKSIFYCGFQWDSKRNGVEYRKMFSLLDQQGCLSIYGPEDKWDCTPNSVKGMTFEEDQFREAMRECEIVLVLHTQRNLDQGAPAARVFEAAAACCVIISDRNPFIEREFGDCILYVDHTASGEALFEQINAHRQWILEHPNEAEAMARKAHSIFSSKFTLERQLERFKAFHLLMTTESLLP